MLEIIHEYLVRPVQNFIYPPVCFTCNALLQNDEERICVECWNSFTRLDSSHPTWREIHGKLHSEGVVENLISCYLFEKDGKLQDVIHHLKYGGIKSFGVRLGRELGKRVLQEKLFDGIDFLVPVPLHKLKRRERGYNQCEYICKGIFAVTNIPIADAFLERKKYTQSQTQLNLQERKENVSEAFKVRPDALRIICGKSFLLVDDVITTGSTIQACAQQLRTAGAAKILAASVALAQ